MTWHLLPHHHHDNAQAAPVLSGSHSTTERQQTPMSTTAEVQTILADARQRAADLFHAIDAGLAKALEVGEEVAPVAATVISDLEPALQFAGIPSAVIGPLAAGLRKLAANPAVAQLAAAERNVPNPEGIAAETIAAATQTAAAAPVTAPPAG